MKLQKKKTVKSAPKSYFVYLDNKEFYSIF